MAIVRLNLTGNALGDDGALALLSSLSPAASAALCALSLGINQLTDVAAAAKAADRAIVLPPLDPLVWQVQMQRQLSSDEIR